MLVHPHHSQTSWRHHQLCPLPIWKQHTNKYFNLTLLLPTPTSPLSTTLLAAPVSFTLVSFYNRWKPQCWLKAPISFSIFSRLSMFRDILQTWVSQLLSHLFNQIFFVIFLSRFSLYITLKHHQWDWLFLKIIQVDMSTSQNGKKTLNWSKI